VAVLQQLAQAQVEGYLLLSEMGGGSSLSIDTHRSVRGFSLSWLCI